MKRYTTVEVAEIWGVTDKHVRNLIKKGSLRPINIGAGKSRVLRITEEELLRFEASRTEQPTRRKLPFANITNYY